MVDKNRIRRPRNVTLNPDGVDKLLAIGKSLPVPEENLSRLIDVAIAEYVGTHGKQDARKSKKG